MYPGGLTESAKGVSISAPLARSPHSTAMTSERPCRNGRAPSSPRAPRAVRASAVGPARQDARAGRVVSSSQARRRRARRGQHPPHDISADIGGVDGVQHGEIRRVERRYPGPQRRTEPVGPVFGDHRPRRRWHVDDRGTQHHHHLVAAAAVQSGDRGTQPATLAGKHLRHAVAGSGAGGQHDPGAANGLRHANSVNLSDSETMSATHGALGLDGFNRLTTRTECAAAGC